MSNRLRAASSDLSAVSDWTIWIYLVSLLLLCRVDIRQHVRVKDGGDHFVGIEGIDMNGMIIFATCPNLLALLSRGRSQKSEVFAFLSFLSLGNFWGYNAIYILTDNDRYQELFP